MRLCGTLKPCPPFGQEGCGQTGFIQLNPLAPEEGDQIGGALLLHRLPSP